MPLFADSSYYVALLLTSDQGHARAVLVDLRTRLTGHHNCLGFDGSSEYIISPTIARRVPVSTR